MVQIMPDLQQHWGLKRESRAASHNMTRNNRYKRLQRRAQETRRASFLFHRSKYSGVPLRLPLSDAEGEQLSRLSLIECLIIQPEP